MRLVFLGDIHANLPALEAVLEEVRKRPPDAVYHLGNVVGYGPHPRATLARLRTLGIEGVRGNHDERIATGFPVPVGDAGEDTRDLAETCCAWTQERLDARERRDLARLPFMRLLPTGRMRVAMFNTSPVGLEGTAHAGREDDFFREMAEYTGAEVHVFARCHAPFWRVVQGKWFVGAGSLGFPSDGDPRSPFVTVELNGGAAVRISRVAYDARQTADAIRAERLPAGLLRLLPGS
jgi:predicted phosphodiesterase